jgi:hypothetical protein
VMIVLHHDPRCEWCSVADREVIGIREDLLGSTGVRVRDV